MEGERRLCAPFFDLGAKQMKDISLRILDMECAACVARLDRALEKPPGVQRAAVNYTAASALITYDEGVTDLAAIAARVRRAGFRVPVEEQDLLPAEADAAKTAAAADALRAVFGVKDVAVQADGTLTAYLWPIGVDGRDLAAACADAGCAVTLGELRGGDADQELEKRMDLLKTLVTSACCMAPLMLEMHPKLQFLAGTALQFGPGRYFYKSAWRGARNRTFGMDFLVSLSSALIYLYSAYVTFTPRRSDKLYFASDGVLLSLILFGKYMEQVAAGEANSAIRKLMHLQPRTAMVQRGDTFVELPVDQIAEHDRVRIRPGERVPVDGTIVSGQCAVDESMLTGESMPVDKVPGDKVIGGSLNRSGSAIVSAEALGKASVLEQIIQIVRQAQCEKAPVQRFADKVARGGVVLGTLGIADTRKTEAAAVVAQLKAAGKEVWMMTGDHARTAEAIAAEVGIDHVLSEVRPDEKAAAIERLRAQGKTVCMVGDGINDTPALAVADCAVAMGGGSEIAIESAGILLPSGNLERLPELFDISRATICTIRQNLTWALFYNLVSIPIAALGVLHPSICATAMSASSIGVLMHSLRLKDGGKKERRFPWKKKS